MRYFTNYYTAKKLAEKRGLIEREYGDTGYMLGCEPLSYCEWNKSGSRLIPERKSQAKIIKQLVRSYYGIAI